MIQKPAVIQKLERLLRQLEQLIRQLERLIRKLTGLIRQLHPGSETGTADSGTRNG